MARFQKKYLFSPGPVLSSERVKRAVLEPDLCHRRREFESLYRGLREKLVRLFKGNEEYTAVVITGSGTSANESVISSVVKDSEGVLVISNGEFGERLAGLARIYKLPTHQLSFEWGKEIDVEKVEKYLEEQGQRIKLIAMVFHETSTGMINPVRKIGELARRYGKLFFVDAISAIGGEDVNVVEQNIDFCTGVPNKCISGLPGVSFVCFRKDALRGRDEVGQRTDYLCLQSHLELAENLSQTPHTPAVQLFIALDEALEELFEEGLFSRIQRYRRCAAIIREKVRDLGLKILVPDNLASNTVTSIFLPEDIPLDEFIDRLDDKGYIVYPGKGHLKDRNLFQIANMGWIDEEACHRFLKVLERTLEEFGYQPP